MSKVLDLRSDTVSHPTKEMREAMAKAEVGDVVLNDDPSVLRLEKMGAELFGKEACLLTASGTMSNQMAIFSLTNRCDQIIAHKNAHIYNLERSGLAQISGVQVRALATADGKYDMEELKANIVSDSIQSAPTKVVCMENTFNLNDGKCIPKSHIDEVAELAHSNGVSVFMDGARILNAALAMNIAPKDLVENCDAVALCLTKGLACPIGSLLCGSRKFIEKARFVRQMLGGGWRQGGIIAAAGIVALEDYQRLEEDHKAAKYLKQELAKIEPRLAFNSVETNILAIDLEAIGMTAKELEENLAKEAVLVKPIGTHRVRMICHIDIGREDLNTVIKAWDKVLHKK